MKKLTYLLAVVFLVLFSVTNCNSQIQVFGKLSDGKIAPDLNIFGTIPVSEKLNLTSFALFEENWSELLVGVSYSPTDYLSIGVGGGIESASTLYRFCGSIWLGKGNASLLILGEKGDGRDNYWYKSTFDYKLSENFSVGMIAWRFTGVGPVANLRIKKLDSKLWLFPAYDFESKKPSLTLGIDIKM